MSDDKETRKAFHNAVNMTQSELARWLERDESKSVGVTTSGRKKKDSGGGDSIGHDSGRSIMAILGKKAADLGDDDYAHMRKVVGYVKRHVAQKPEKEPLEDSRWRYSLMNWGHDPLKD